MKPTDTEKAQKTMYLKITAKTEAELDHIYEEIQFRYENSDVVIDTAEECTAALALLAACERALKFCSRPEMVSDESGRVWNVLNDAIAKAKGE